MSERMFVEKYLHCMPNLVLFERPYSHLFNEEKGKKYKISGFEFWWKVPGFGGKRHVLYLAKRVLVAPWNYRFNISLAVFCKITIIPKEV